MRNGNFAFGSFLVWIVGSVGLSSVLLSTTLLSILENHDAPETFLVSEHSWKPNGEEWPFPFVHIVNSRFMQDQGNLTELARARLVLFENFCVGSMTNQSLLQLGLNPAPFLWIIKVDPNLSDGITQKLLSLVKPYPFIYIVASNVNFGIGIHPGGWRGGEAGNDVLSSKIYSGDIKWLRIAHESRNSRAILETRLDADDGLHTSYLEVIQKEAKARLRCTDKVYSSSRQDWMYWCPMNRLEWNPLPAGFSVPEYGMFLPRQSPHVCISAGLTVGVSVGVNENRILRFPHQSLYQKLGALQSNSSCGGSKCLHQLSEPMLGAIRSRTLTSAGMRGIVANEAHFASNKKYDVGSNPGIWELLLKDFHVTQEGSVKANQYLQSRGKNIVEDNLSGQCTPGHSCKNSTKKALLSLLHKP